jgi:hypothetical protein
MRARVTRGEVVNPTNVDLQNLPVMLGSYLTACQIVEPPLAAAPLPCELQRGSRTFAAGMHSVGTDRYYAVSALHKGGILRVAERGERLAYEDAGWIARSGAQTYASQMLGLSRFAAEGSDSVVVSASFGLVRQEQLTPARFVVLRLLNLTVFRSLTLGNWVRRMLIARLITNVEPAGIALERRLRFAENRIDVHDRLRLTGELNVDALELTRSFTGIHMGSAKYFHPSEATSLPMPDTSGLADTLNRERQCELRYAIVFDRNSVRIEQ